MKKRPRKLLCVLMSLLLCLPLAGLFGAAGEEPLTVFVASDLHYRPPGMLAPIGEQTGLPGDPLYWHTNIQGQLEYESDAIVNEMLRRFESSPAKVLLIPGDLADSHIGYHLALAEKFRLFERRTGKKIFVINGNHDVKDNADGFTTDLARFKAAYAGCGYSEALAADPGSASYTADLGGGYRLLAVDSCVYGTSDGEINAQRLAWIESQVAAAETDGVKLIGMMHHSILEHFKIQGLVADTVKDYRALAERFAGWGIKVVLTGHKHANDITCAVSASGARIYDIETNCLINYPNTYRVINFSDNEIQVTSGYIDRIDLADLPPGYNSAQLELLANDFPAFSYGYFKAAMQRYVNEYAGTPRKLAGSLNIREGTPAYEALAAVMGVLGGALSLPLYDTAGTPAIDSVEEIAAAGGENIAASGYARFSDLVALIVSRMFAGDENTPYEAPEVQLLLQAVKAGLVYAILNIPDASASALFAGLGVPGAALKPGRAAYAAAAKLLFAKTAANKILAAAVKPLVEGITVDSFSPADLNVTLEGYAACGAVCEHGDPLSGPQVLLDYLNRFLNLLLSLMAALAAPGA